MTAKGWNEASEGRFLLRCMSPVIAHSVNSDSYLEWSLSEA
jgi:hypothetical protein